MFGTSQVVHLSIVNYIVCIHESFKSLLAEQWDKGMCRHVCVFVCVCALRNQCVCVCPVQNCLWFVCSTSSSGLIRGKRKGREIQIEGGGGLLFLSSLLLCSPPVTAVSSLSPSPLTSRSHHHFPFFSLHLSAKAGRDRTLVPSLRPPHTRAHTHVELQEKGNSPRHVAFLLTLPLCHPRSALSRPTFCFCHF